MSQKIKNCQRKTFHLLCTKQSIFNLVLKLFNYNDQKINIVTSKLMFPPCLGTLLKQSLTDLKNIRCTFAS